MLLEMHCLPVVTSFIFTIVTIIDGSVLTETIFSWPGMGQLNFR